MKVSISFSGAGQNIANRHQPERKEVKLIVGLAATMALYLSR
jgi:hypothetical protein